jgi:hypothetical protein
MAETTRLNLDNKSLIIDYSNTQELYDLLRGIHGYTELELAEKFDLTLSAVQNWTKKDREPPKWVITYLSDTLELKLSLIGYMLKLKKASFVTYNIEQIQATINDFRVEGGGDLPQNPFTLQIGNLITESKAIDTAVLSNMAKILTKFYNKHTRNTNN